MMIEGAMKSVEAGAAAVKFRIESHHSANAMEVAIR